MFWRNKVKGELKEKDMQKDVQINKATENACDIPVLKREVKNARSVINGKLYDTGKSEYMSCFKDNRILFRTPNGNYFSCKRYNSDYVSTKERISLIVYSDIRPENIGDAKEEIGKYDVDRYIELFGEPELA